MKTARIFRSISRSIMALMIVAIVGAGLTGRGSDEVSFATQEQARQQVNENAEYNATNWRDANSPSYKILMRGDSTIGPSCATGDGWVTVDLINPKNKNDVKELKCSSVSGTIGCLTKEDFQERKDYSKQDGHCNTKLPFPLPKIQL